MLCPRALGLRAAVCLAALTNYVCTVLHKSMYMHTQTRIASTGGTLLNHNDHQWATQHFTCSGVEQISHSMHSSPSLLKALPSTSLQSGVVSTTIIALLLRAIIKVALIVYLQDGTSFPITHPISTQQPDSSFSFKKKKRAPWH